MSKKQRDETPGPTGELFEDLGVPAAPVATAAAAKSAAATRARVVMPNRQQVELRPMDLESLLPAGHRARIVWAWVVAQDLGAMYASIKVREGGVGRSAIAPEILFALWLYATLQGVGSARELSRLVMSHDAYRWISGGVQVNYHALSDFRVEHGKALDELLSTSLAALLGLPGPSSSNAWPRTACAYAPAPGRHRFGGAARWRNACSRPASAYRP